MILIKFVYPANELRQDVTISWFVNADDVAIVQDSSYTTNAFISMVSGGTHVVNSTVDEIVAKHPGLTLLPLQWNDGVAVYINAEKVTAVAATDGGSTIYLGKSSVEVKATADMIEEFFSTK